MKNAQGELWEEVLADATALAEEYRENGWEVRTVHPGDVSPTEKDERFGLSVLLPGSEYEEIESLIDDPNVSFDGAEVYQHTVGTVVYAVVIELDTTTEVAVVIPMAYSVAEFETIFEQAFEDEELQVHLRPLTIDQWVTFVHDDPSLFVDESHLQSVIEQNPRRQAQAAIQAERDRLKAEGAARDSDVDADGDTDAESEGNDDS
ncbi:hypothetical protein ACLI4Q_05045 [Natrialbaceae archaeon A-CW1-1]